MPSTPAITSPAPGPGNLHQPGRTCLWHPQARPGSPYRHLVPVPATITAPLCVGLDPGTGEPLTLRLWHPDRGGQVIAVLSEQDGGHATVLDSVTERITACPDARLIQVSLSQAPGAGLWAPLAAAAALGGQEGRAAQILHFSADAIRARSCDPARVTRIHQPAPGKPQYVLAIDNPGPLAAGNPAACHILGWITALCRSEGWTVILTAPRLTTAALGGTQVQANIDMIIARQPAEPPGPDGGGAETPAVFGICDVRSGQVSQRGHAFCWQDRLATVGPVVAARLAARRPHLLEPALAGLSRQWDQITSR